MSDDARKVVVTTSTTWAGSGRVSLLMTDGRKHTLTVEEAETLFYDLTAALVEFEPDPIEIEVADMFNDEPRCPAATHGPRNTTCTCEDSRDE